MNKSVKPSQKRNDEYRTAEFGEGNASSDFSQRYGYKLSILSNRLSLWTARTYGRKFGVSVVEWRALAYLFANGECAARDITVNTLMDKGNVSRAIGSLVKKGLVIRREDRADGRRILVRLTASGKRLYGAISAQSEGRQQRLALVLTVDEQCVLDRALAKLGVEADRMLDETELPAQGDG